MNAPKDDIFQSFFDIWQKQLEAGMKDPELMGNMLKLMQNMQQQFMAGQQYLQETVAKTVGNADNSKPKSEKDLYNYEWFKNPFAQGNFSGPGAASHLSPDGDDAADELACSLAALEERVAYLESQLAISSRAVRRAKKGKSGKAGRSGNQRRSKKNR